MTYLYRYRLILFGIFFILLMIPWGAVRAMTVSPVRVELSGDPGTTISSSFKVTNDESEAKTLYTTVENFEALGETGTPSFKIGDEDLAGWVRSPESIEISAGETKTIEFEVVIPESAEAGGYFAAIFLGSNPPSSDSSEVTIGSRIGTLLLFRVNGEIVEGGSLLEFATKNQRKVYPALPINFYYRFQNSGADRIFPKGSLTIKNTFGMTTRVIDVNPTQGNILPNSIRRFEPWWTKRDITGLPSLPPDKQTFFEAASYQWQNFAFGKYRAELTITYGTDGQTVRDSYTIFVFPWHLLLIELVGFVILFFIIRIFIKRYNSWIIKKSKGGRS